AKARVVARDANDAVVSNVAISAADGTYSLTVPAKRDAKGVPIKVLYTLRADAGGFQTFPTAPRVALPIDISAATSTAADQPRVLKSASTDISLIPLENASGLGSVAGKVIGDNPGGVLVVAGKATGVADFSGAYEVFNVPAGTGVEVRGYAAGLQIKPATADVKAGMQTAGVDLTISGKATAAVSGKIDIVNPGDGTRTSVALAVE